MDYKTIYQVTAAEPESSKQILQNLFHFHGSSDLFKMGTSASQQAFCIFAIAAMLTVISLCVISSVRYLLGKRKPLSSNAQAIFFLVAMPLCAVVVFAAFLILHGIPYHAEHVQAYERGEYTKLEGKIYDTKVATSGEKQKSYFKVNGTTVTIYSSSPGFDEPFHPAIGDGQRVRICMIDGGGNPPIILRFDVLKPFLTTGHRQVEYW